MLSFTIILESHPHTHTHTHTHHTKFEYPSQGHCVDNRDGLFPSMIFWTHAYIGEWNDRRRQNVDISVILLTIGHWKLTP